MSLKQAFLEHMEAAAALGRPILPSTGDYLNGTPYDDVLAWHMEKNTNGDIDRAKQIIVEKTELWKKHVGDYFLYFLGEEDGKFEVRSFWFSELAQLEERWEVDKTKPMNQAKMPRLKRKIQRVEPKKFVSAEPVQTSEDGNQRLTSVLQRLNKLLKKCSAS